MDRDLYEIDKKFLNHSDRQSKILNDNLDGYGQNLKYNEREKVIEAQGHKNKFDILDDLDAFVNTSRRDMLNNHSYIKEST